MENKTNLALTNFDTFFVSYCEKSKQIKKWIEKVDCNKYLEKIKNGEWEDQIRTLRKLYKEKLKTGDKKPYTKEKVKLPVLAFSGVFIQKFINSSYFLIDYTHWIILDIDQDENRGIKSESDIQELKEKLKAEKFIYSIFVSPSGYGLKILLKGNQSKPQHELLFKQLEEYFNKTHSIIIDKKGININRLCYISFDPDLYINRHAEIYELQETDLKNEPIFQNKGISKLSDLSEGELKTKITHPESKTIHSATSNREILDNLLSYLIHTNNSITFEYENWIKVGFGLISEFGKDSKLASYYFHEFSKLDKHKYNYNECERTFQQLAKDNKEKIRFASILYLSKEKGFTTQNSVIADNLKHSINLLNLIKYGSFFKSPDEIILFEFFMIKAKAFGHKQFYYSVRRIEEETKIKRTRQTKIIRFFQEVGILNVELKGCPRVNYFAVNFERIIALYECIYNNTLLNEEKKKKKIY